MSTPEPTEGFLTTVDNPTMRPPELCTSMTWWRIPAISVAEHERQMAELRGLYQDAEAHAIELFKSREAAEQAPRCRYCANPADGNEGLDDIDGALSHEACRTGHYQSALWKAEAAVACYEYDTAFEAAYENASADRAAFRAILRDVQIYHGGEGCHECSLGLGHGETAVLPDSGSET